MALGKGGVSYWRGTPVKISDLTRAGPCDTGGSEFRALGISCAGLCNLTGAICCLSLNVAPASHEPTPSVARGERGTAASGSECKGCATQYLDALNKINQYNELMRAGGVGTSHGGSRSHPDVYLQEILALH